MRLAIVTPSFYPMIGGIELYTLNMSRELKRRGHEVLIYTPNRVMGRHLTPHEEEIDGIKVRRIRTLIELSYRVKLWPSLASRLVEDKPDVIHTYSHDTYSIPALIAARALGKPLIVTTYGPFSSQAEYGALKRCLFMAYDTTVTPSLFHLANKILARYPSAVRWVKHYGIPENKIGLEPSGIPKECLKLRDGKIFREKLGINGPMVLYVGRMSPQKGVQHLVKAACYVVKEFPDISFVLIGPDYINYKGELLKIARGLHVDKNLSFIDPVYNLEKELEAYAACDIFVMPSSFEGFSQAVLKAMAQGKPVIATNVGGLPYEVDYGKCGILVPYANFEALAKAIVKLFASPEEACKLAEEAKHRVQNFTYDVLAKSLERVYREVLGV